MDDDVRTVGFTPMYDPNFDPEKVKPHFGQKHTVGSISGTGAPMSDETKEKMVDEEVKNIIKNHVIGTKPIKVLNKNAWQISPPLGDALIVNGKQDVIKKNTGKNKNVYLFFTSEKDTKKLVKNEILREYAKLRIGIV